MRNIIDIDYEELLKVFTELIMPFTYNIFWDAWKGPPAKTYLYEYVIPVVRLAHPRHQSASTLRQWANPLTTIAILSRNSAL